MAISLNLANEIRDRLHNLEILRTEEHMGNYDHYLIEVIKGNEDVKYLAYRDTDKPDTKNTV